MAKPKNEQQTAAPAVAAAETAGGAVPAPAGAPADTGAGEGDPAPVSADPMTPLALCDALDIDAAQVFALNLDTRTVVTIDGQKHRLA